MCVGTVLLLLTLAASQALPDAAPGIQSFEEPNSAKGIRAVREAEDRIRVIAAGRFETTFTKRKGFGSTWFDLRHDPAKQRDLAPVLDENGFFWIKIGKPGTDASWYANPAEELKLIEEGPACVRIQTRGPHRRYGYTDPKAAWNELRFDQTYTLYPDGSVFIAYTLEQNEPVPFHHFLVITKSNGAWGSQGKGEGKGEVSIAGESGAEKPNLKSPTSFTLQWSDGPAYFTDILMVARNGQYGASYWNEGYLDKDIRCSFDLGSYWPNHTLPAGKQRLHFLMRFADDINSARTAAMHAADYRSPDRLAVANGAVEAADDGDWDADGFNETEGCYVLRTGADGVRFTLHGKSIARIHPVFKIHDWPGLAPAAIRLGERTLIAGKDFVASLRAATLVLQVFSTVNEDAAIVIPSNQVTK